MALHPDEFLAPSLERIWAPLLKPKRDVVTHKMEDLNIWSFVQKTKERRNSHGSSLYHTLGVTSALNSSYHWSLCVPEPRGSGQYNPSLPHVLSFTPFWCTIQNPQLRAFIKNLIGLWEIILYTNSKSIAQVTIKCGIQYTKEMHCPRCRSALA